MIVSTVIPARRIYAIRFSLFFIRVYPMYDSYSCVLFYLILPETAM